MNAIMPDPANTMMVAVDSLISILVFRFLSLGLVTSQFI